MSRMKTFFKYFLMVVAFFIFSNIMIHALLKVSYTDIKDYEIDVNDLFVEVKEAKASNRNGNINGIVKNNNDTAIENKYLKISMLSNHGKVLGEKYVKIDKIEPKQMREFEVKFDYDNVKSFKIELSDTAPYDPSIPEMIEMLKNNTNGITTDIISFK